ncbi:ester hydrolase C11orf54 homolog isoform X2 [Daktulosphaira vitifoliae]|uniref:ester hydrolase C11orf54 homolog isoform X2 n=1 Tax=Daktulosphaira vitifoliae TaxID=58002 RepID=UPI0021A984A6|nr:ester hydrolase C11orf54 homolog isoform X2 [Daktulosphaira vitifoliae]
MKIQSYLFLVILPELSKNFKRVSIEIVQCPDLTQSPFFLVSEGLSGNENIIDVGSPSYLFPIVNKDKVYKFEDLQQITGSDQIFIIGASGSAWPYHGELAANFFKSGNNVKNDTRIVKINHEKQNCITEKLPINETRFAFLANYYSSNGLKGEVLRIECEKRIGPLDFLTSIRQALTKFYGNKLVGLGGVILIETGKVKVHVMPEFSKTPINSEDDLNKWLKFFEIPTPLVGLGYFVSHDPGLDLRLQHFHLYSEHGVGGHYRCDTEPATIKYTAYLNVANNLYRVDQPDGNYSSN